MILWCVSILERVASIVSLLPKIFSTNEWWIKMNNYWAMTLDDQPAAHRVTDHRPAWCRPLSKQTMCVRVAIIIDRCMYRRVCAGIARIGYRTPTTGCDKLGSVTARKTREPSFYDHFQAVTVRGAAAWQTSQPSLCPSSRRFNRTQEDVSFPAGLA